MIGPADIADMLEEIAGAEAGDTFARPEVAASPPELTLPTPLDVAAEMIRIATSLIP